MNTRTLDTHTSAYRINTIVEGLNRHFGTLTRDTGDVLNRNQTLFHLRHLLLKQPLQEQRSRTAQDDLRVLVLVIYLYYHRANHLSFAVEIRRDLVLFRQVELVALFVKQQHLFLPHLVQLTRHHLTDHLFVLLIKHLFLQLKDLRCQGLTQVQDHTTAKRSQLHFIRHLFADLCLVIQQQGVAQRNLRIRVRHVAILHHQTVTVDLQVTLVRVHDHRVVRRRTVHLCNNALERLLQHRDKGLFVNAFEVFKLRENVNQIDRLLLFFCCHFLIYC